MEQETYIIKLQNIELATKFRGVVDTQAILDKRFIAAEIMWLAGIDRYLKESTTSAAEGLQRYREDGTPYSLELVPQFLGSNCTHVKLPPALQLILLFKR